MFRKTLQQDKIVVLLYHRISPDIKFDPYNITVTPDIFIRQIEKIARKYTFISLSEAMEQSRMGIAKSKTQVVLTFDDGYQDNYEIAFPILKKKSLPATFFIVCNYIDNYRPLWDCEIIKMIYNNKIRRVKILNEFISRRYIQPRRFFVFKVIGRMKSLSNEIREKVLGLLRKDLVLDSILGLSNDNDRCMSWEQIKKMNVNGMEIGSHGLSHSSLKGISFSEAMQEIRKSKEVIENNIRTKCLHFAFPFGSQRDYSQKLIDGVKDAGFQTCSLNVLGYNYIGKDTFCFKRIAMKDTTNLKVFN